jgi:protein tyrosine phosphatase (PTP) superfamily phosphohydrolase (DUF442 family)
MTDDPLKRIRNFVRLSDRIGTSGQPAEEQFALIRDAGFEVVINLLPSEREVANEGQIVALLGMDYANIPVIWGAPTVESVGIFFAVMDAMASRKVFVHCAVNMRVSAFMYLYRTLRLGEDEEEAEADLHDIWVPDGVWADLIATVRARFRADGGLLPASKETTESDERA